MEIVKVYGADWCKDTRRTREHLESLGVVYEYIDIEQDEQAARWVRERNNGKESKPTVKLGEQTLSTPDNEELESALRQHGLISEHTKPYL